MVMNLGFESLAKVYVNARAISKCIVVHTAEAVYLLIDATGAWHEVTIPLDDEIKFQIDDEDTFPLGDEASALLVPAFRTRHRPLYKCSWKICNGWRTQYKSENAHHIAPNRLRIFFNIEILPIGSKDSPNHPHNTSFWNQGAAAVILLTLKLLRSQQNSQDGWPLCMHRK